MKLLKVAFVVLGLLVLVGAVAVLISNAWNLRILYEIAMANKSEPSVTNPTNLVLIGAGLAAGGGLLLGLGIAFPRRSASAVRHETLDQVHRQETVAQFTADDAHAEEPREPQL